MAGVVLVVHGVIIAGGHDGSAAGEQGTTVLEVISLGLKESVVGVGAAIDVDDGSLLLVKVAVCNGSKMLPCEGNKPCRSNGGKPVLNMWPEKRNKFGNQFIFGCIGEDVIPIG